jgi:hypothetical protein
MVLWASIAASRSYEVFTGCVELLGGILLFIPATAPLGAIISLAAAARNIRSIGETAGPPAGWIRRVPRCGLQDPKTPPAFVPLLDPASLTWTRRTQPTGGPYWMVMRPFSAPLSGSSWSWKPHDRAAVNAFVNFV